MTDALCLGSAHLVFPTLDDGTDDDNAPAPEFCLRCPMSLSCLKSGWPEKFGIWGGFNVAERRYAKAAQLTPEELWNTRHSTDT